MWSGARPEKKKRRQNESKVKYKKKYMCNSMTNLK
jgi:hypothetical protein